jgi:hypothetical protein
MWCLAWYGDNTVGSMVEKIDVRGTAPYPVAILTGRLRIGEAKQED